MSSRLVWLRRLRWLRVDGQAQFDGMDQLGSKWLGWGRIEFAGLEHRGGTASEFWFGWRFHSRSGFEAVSHQHWPFAHHVLWKLSL